MLCLPPRWWILLAPLLAAGTAQLRLSSLDDGGSAGGGRAGAAKLAGMRQAALGAAAKLEDDLDKVSWKMRRPPKHG